MILSGRNKTMLPKKIITILITGLILTTTTASAINNNRTEYTINHSTQQSNFESTGYFYVTEEDGIWWFIDPNGEKFYSLGMSFISVDDYFYGNVTDWVTQTQQRLDEWGFNTLNGGDTHLFPTMPYIYKFKFKQKKRKLWLIQREKGH